MWSLGTLSPALMPIIGLVLTWVNQNKVDLGGPRWDGEYDYIVVGSGSAGSVIANRLTEDPDVKVLVLEAGGAETLLSELPMACGLLQLSEVDWAYRTVPQENACWGLEGRVSNWPRGKVLGGCSTINFMLYVRGNKRDYDQWARREGCPGWSWDEIFPYFLKAEDNRDEFYAKNGFHSTGGYQTVSTPPVISSISDDFIKAGQYLGYPTGDYNGAVQSVFSHPQCTIRDGLRCSAAKAYLQPAAKRPNLSIVTHAQVTKVLTRRTSDNGHEAYGVQFNHSGSLHEVFARREVILSAGAIGSPQILMLSGIGPAEHLNELGIPVIADLPVGDNLQDHIYSGIYFTTKPMRDDQKTAVNLTVMQVAQFLQDKSGPISSPGGVEGFGFIKTNFTDKYDDWPDFQIHFTPQFASMGSLLMKKAQNIGSEYLNKFVMPYIMAEASFMFPVMLRPKSRGTIRLRSPDPMEHPIIDPRYYSHPDDLEAMAQAMRITMSLVNTPPLRRHHAELFKTRVPQCKRHRQYSHEDLACMAQTYTSTLYHPAGTARMGALNDSRAVVDPRLRVKGVKRLRVADASIMPTIVSGNTNAPCMVIGERVSDFIKEDARQLKEKSQVQAQAQSESQSTAAQSSPRPRSPARSGAGGADD